MKIICDKCGAKYSIADEKVAGRNFKIRCKTEGCGNVIPVQGEQIQPAADAGFNYGSDQVWHVVVDGDQQGPFTPEQLGVMITENTIDWEAYVWREGLEDWKPARDLPELVSSITQQPQEPAASAASMPAATEAAAAAAADPFAGAGDAFGGGAGDANANPFSGADPFAGGGGGDDLFGSSTESEFGGDDVVASSPSPRVSTEQAMTGQRNENSVLFSLANLQALATGGEASPSSPPSAAAPVGQATTEGSGLIDIRALASATAATSSGGNASAGTSDLLSIGGGGGLGPSLGSPVLAPVAEEPEESSNKMLVIGAIMGTLVVGLAIALLVVLMGGDDETVAMNAAPETAQGATPATPATPAEPAVPSAAGAAEEAEEPAEEEAEEAEEEAETEARPSSGSAMRRRPSGGSMAAAPSPMTTAMAQTEAQMRATARMDSSSSIDDLLSGATGSNRSSMMAASMSNLPDQPSRSDVAGALGRLRSSVQSCGNGTSGTARAAIVFANSGRVQNVNVTGVPAPVQSCVASRVRSARVPAFSRSTFRVTYPYAVR